MKKTFTILVLFIFIVLSACNLPTKTTSDAPRDFAFGTWNCSYLENGLYAAVPLVMDQNGTAEFQYKSGTWTFNSQANTFTFSTDVPIQQAVYSPENKTLELILTAGQTIGGNTSLSCAAPQ